MVDQDLRKELREASSSVLYEDQRYVIGVSNREPDAHHLLVNRAYTLLPKGVFNELARADTHRLLTSLKALGAEVVLEEMLSNDIPLQELGWALAKAAIKDQEDFASYLAEQKRL